MRRFGSPAKTCEPSLFVSRGRSPGAIALTADRFATVEQFQRALTSALQAPQDSRQPSRWWRRVVLGLAVATVVGGVAAGVRAKLSAPRAGAPVREAVIRSLAVESFENLTGDSAQV